MKKILSFFLFILISLVYAQSKEDQIIVPNRVNAISQQEKSYVVLISIDGFRYDYFEKYQPNFLSEVLKRAVRAEYMVPAFPSVTFPNHYTLVTGMFPPRHGLVGNNMLNIETGERYSLRNSKAVRNSDWYAGVPIWSLAESQNMLTACFYWPGSEAKIAGYYPTYHYPYSESKGLEERVKQVIDWLEKPVDERPHLITFYMPEVDKAGHRFGPDSKENQLAVEYIDSAMEKLTQAIDKTGLPVNFIFLSDHGMEEVDRERPIRLPKIDTEKMQIVNNGTYTSIFVEDENNIEEIYNYFKKEATDQYAVYLKTEVPEKYCFSDKEDIFQRIGDIVLIAEAPYLITNTKPIAGAHGYLAEDTPNMNTVFMAWGPDIQEGKQIEAFDNIHIYPLLAKLLDLEYTHEIDGDNRLLEKVIKNETQ